MPLLPRHLGRYLDPASFETAWSKLASRAGAGASVAGTSVEGRPIACYTFGSKGPAALLTGLIHGNEWIGSVALFDFVRSLVDVEDPLLRHARLVVVPVVNPDAVDVNGARLAAGKPAFRRGNANGVDLNRNFPQLSSKRPRHPFAGSAWRRSPHYVGPHPFSEPETRALRDVALAARPRVAIGFHSFGEMLLYPWAFTEAPNPRAARYEKVGARFRRALAAREYRVMQATRFYPTIGDFDDWLDAELGTMAFTVEVSRPSRALLHPRRIFNPFCWMNPVDVDATVTNLTPALRALSDEALAA